VLVERPEREIPLQPEFAALRLKPGPTEKVDVRLMPQDSEDGISINTRA
jgi:pyrimidine operon attenuation protein/uracil phosphoribosyltransferase